MVGEVAIFVFKVYTQTHTDTHTHKIIYTLLAGAGGKRCCRSESVKLRGPLYDMK